MPSHYGLFAARATAMRNVLAHNVRCNVRNVRNMRGRNARNASNGRCHLHLYMCRKKEKHNA